MIIAAWLSYDGTPFAGFAKQNDQLTVQGELEYALELLFRREVETTCAGRTDAGVHALCQVVSFELLDDEWYRRKPEKLLRSLNALTHDDISIRDIQPMPDDFSARFSAKSREYRYYICTDESAPLLMTGFCWHLGKPLNVEAMNNAAQYLIGEHDFKSFCMAVSAKGKRTYRYVAKISFSHEHIWDSNFVVITVVGNAFLHSMVRTMVGTLVEVGLGKREPEWVRDVLEARSRQAAGQNAPAQGLILWNVDYEGETYYEPGEDPALGETIGTPSSTGEIEEIPPAPIKMELPEIVVEEETLEHIITEELEVAAPADFETPTPKFTREKKKAQKKAAKKAKKARMKAVRREYEPVYGSVFHSIEKSREFTIPRGPNMDETNTGEFPAVSGAPFSGYADVPAAQSFSGSTAQNESAATHKTNTISFDDTDAKPHKASKQSAKARDDSEHNANTISFNDDPAKSGVMSTVAARARRRAREAQE